MIHNCVGLTYYETNDTVPKYMKLLLDICKLRNLRCWYWKLQIRLVERVEK